MKIHNIRYGFATNSSSSHSIVVGANPAFDQDADGDFGWQNFIAVSPEAKLRWFAAHFNGYGDDLFPNDPASQAKREILGFTDEQIVEYKDDYVDHQSNFCLSNYFVDDDFKDFVADFKAFLLRPDVSIYGGNDNDDNDITPTDAQKFEVLDRVTDLGSETQMRVRKEGDYYTLFNSSSGFKIRMSFSDSPNWEKSRSPELVDLKISDYCPYGCEFCYQGSTKEGKHAPLERIKKIIDTLSETGVFEVAIGGGEPTEHPNFVEIIQYCHEKGIIPNFTTFSTKWLTDDEMVSAVRKYCRGVGVSVHSAKNMGKITKIKETLSSGYYSGVTVMAQHVVGSISVDELYKLVQECLDNGIQLLLLGFKTTGFGSSGPQYNIQPSELGTVIQIMKDASKRYWFFGDDAGSRTFVPVTLSIDTQIISLYKEVLEQCSINPNLLSSPEGKFSCYWDAVENKVAKSSYCDKDEFFTIPEINKDQFLSIFEKF